MAFKLDLKMRMLETANTLGSAHDINPALLDTRHQSNANPSGPGQLSALTGIRAVAAIWVVLFHYKADLATLLPSSSALSPVTARGFWAVDLFFLLSGFILAYTYFPRPWRGIRDYVLFLSHRVARIYPVHLFTLLTLLVLLIPALLHHEAVTQTRYTVSSFFEHLFLIQSWGFTNWDTWNQPSWSLSAEWFAYTLIFPLACLLLRRPSGLRAALVFTILPIALYALWDRTMSTDNHFFLIVKVGAEFFSGCALFTLFRNGALSSRISEALAIAGVVEILAVLYGVNSQWLTPLVLVGFLTIILGLSRATGPLSGILSSPFMVYAGEVSFSLYMTHVVIQKVIKILLPPGRFAAASLGMRSGIVLSYALILVCTAVATYELVERPMRTRIRSAFSKRESAA